MFPSGVGRVKGNSDGVWVPLRMARFDGTDSCKRPPLRLCFLCLKRRLSEICYAESASGDREVSLSGHNDAAELLRA